MAKDVIMKRWEPQPPAVELHSPRLEEGNFLHARRFPWLQDQCGARKSTHRTIFSFHELISNLCFWLISGVCFSRLVGPLVLLRTRPCRYSSVILLNRILCSGVGDPFLGPHIRRQQKLWCRWAIIHAILLPLTGGGGQDQNDESRSVFMGFLFAPTYWNENVLLQLAVERKWSGLLLRSYRWLQL